MARRLLSLLCCGIAAINLSACSAKPPQKIIDDGISMFGNGKTEEEYFFQGSGALLDELIDRYSGSYYQPAGIPMTDDEHDDAKKAHGNIGSSSAPVVPPVDPPDDPSSEPSGSSSSESSEDPGTTAPDSDGIPEVSNMTELMRIFHYAYDQTSEYVEFTTVSGFNFDMNTDLQAIYTALQREDPIDVSGVASWSTWNKGREYYISIKYAFDVDELKSMKTETVQLVDDAVKQIGADGLSDYEIVCAVNDYLCDNVYYPEKEPYEPITHTAYGALKNGCAVCEGYACAAKLILNGCGVECDIEVGNCLNGGGHAWNLVKIDGKWYQLDVTWDDQSKDRSDYLLVTDEYMKKSRTWNESDYPVTSKVPYAA